MNYRWSEAAVGCRNEMKAGANFKIGHNSGYNLYFTEQNAMPFYEYFNL
jgi:hypothetical protein